MQNGTNHTFVDGVGDIRMRDGVIRMDLVALSATSRDDAGNPPPEFVGQVVMSPRAFMRMANAMGETLKQMQEKGMVTRSDNDAD